MIATEKEARLKWCPFARVKDDSCATNRHAGEKLGKDGKNRILRGNSLCIASDCMAWNWTATHVKGEDGNLVRNTETYGFCGLAGDPWKALSHRDEPS